MEPMYQRHDPGRRALWVAVGVLSFLVVALAFTLFQRERTRPEPSTGAGSHYYGSAGIRPEPGQPGTPQAAQPADTSPILVAAQAGEGCEPDNTLYDVTVIAIGERASRDTGSHPVYLQDWEKIVRKYYLDLGSVAEADKPRLTRLLAVGQRLKIRYVTCGSGGFRYLTFVQATAAG